MNAAERDAAEPDAEDARRELDARIAAAIEGLGPRLRARRIESGIPYYVEAGDDGQPVHRDVHTDQEWTPEQVEHWREHQRSTRQRSSDHH